MNRNRTPAEEGEQATGEIVMEKVEQTPAERCKAALQAAHRAGAEVAAVKTLSHISRAIAALEKHVEVAERHKRAVKRSENAAKRRAEAQARREKRAKERLAKLEAEKAEVARKLAELNGSASE